VASKSQELERSKPHVGGGDMAAHPQESAPSTGLLARIEHHKNAVLSSPLILAAILILVYSLGGSSIRQVLDFLSPAHLVR
jgi:hypothetical protein